MALASSETREARFTRVYEEHLETVRRYVWRRDPDLCDDVVAETFLVAWRRIDDVPEHAAPWLIGVARNVRRNTQCSARRQEAVSARLADAVPRLDGAGTSRDSSALAAALQGLLDRDREVLLLAVWDGLDRASIAAALGCSDANVSVRLHRARRRFARSLAAHRHDPSPLLVLAPQEATPGARTRRRWSPLVPALAVGVALVVGAGAAWATHALSPTALFRANPNGEGTRPGDLWHQRVIPTSVRRAATIHIAHVGAVQYWYARTRTHGWCGALRLPDGAWLGTGRSALDVGGTVPGCYPTREQVNGQDPVYVLNGFDYDEDDVDAGGQGGGFWRIEYGRVTMPRAVRVTDLVSGRTAKVGRGGTFALALPFPDRYRFPMRLVAEDADGKVIGRT